MLGRARLLTLILVPIALTLGIPQTGIPQTPLRPGAGGEPLAWAREMEHQPRETDQALDQRATPQRSIEPAADLALQAELEDLLAGRAGTYGVAVRNLDTGETVSVNADQEFISASTYKVLVMYRVYQELARGALSLDDPLTIVEADAAEGDEGGWLAPGRTTTVGDALEATITVSSNTAARALIRRVGGWGSLLTAARELGMRGTSLRGGYFRTTPADMLRFFEALAADRLISPGASRAMRQLLARQTINDRIPALLPAGTVVAHKTGELPGVRNDAGIVYGPGGTYVVSVFSRGAPAGEANSTIAELASRVYRHYE